MHPTKIITLLALILLSSCGTLQRSTLWNKGKILELDGKESFPFTEKWGMIFLEVYINGQPFNFLLDTGAPNVLDKKTLAALELDARSYGTVSDAYGKRSRLSYVITKKFDVGSLHHKKVGALVADFRSIPIFDCMDIDGLIGSNMMRKAVWQFDFANKMIHVAPDLSFFDLSQADQLAIRMKNTGTPVADIQLGNSTLRSQTIDFGSGNGITIQKEALPTSVITDTIAISTGNAGTGLYGNQIDTVYYLRTDSLQIGPQVLTNTPLRVRSKTDGLLGLDHWRNYTVTFDWTAGKIYFELNQTDHTIQSFGFGFGTEMRNDSLFVNSLTTPSPASEAGIQLQDLILEIDERPIHEMAYCEILERLDQVDQVQVKVLKRNEEVQIALKKRDLFKD